MKEYPIIFSTLNIKAILDDKKTQTRRVITARNSEVGEGRVDWSKFCWDGTAIYKYPLLTRSGVEAERKASLPFVDGNAKEYHQYLHVPYNWEENETVYRVYPRWEVGYRLWVKETYWEDSGDLYYRADWGENKPVNMVFGNDYGFIGGKVDGGKWRPSIFMPRWASRILLEITEIRAERLQEITEVDAKAEGIIGCPNAVSDCRHHFMVLWDSLNAKRGYGWDENNWVWVYGFKRLK